MTQFESFKPTFGEEPQDSEIAKIQKHSGLCGYERPILRRLGDVRDLTLGPTIGIGESGNDLVFRPQNT